MEKSCMDCKNITGGTETILVVEDETMILDLTKRMLEELGYKVLTASLPNEAIKLAKDGVAFIQKPFSRVDLDSKIREVLKGD